MKMQPSPKMMMGALFFLLCILAGGGLYAEERQPPAIFSPTPTEGEIPFFSIALPHGWRMQELSPNSLSTHDSVAKFVFESADSRSRYLFVEIGEVDSATTRQRLEAASGNEHRSFLSRGSNDVEYFDDTRDLLWSRNSSSSSISVTLFTDRSVTLRFYDNRSKFQDYGPAAKIIVDNVRIYHDAADYLSSPYTVSEDLFFSVSRSGRFLNFHYLWMTAVAVCLLFASERWIAYRRRKHEMKELNESIERRKGKKHKNIRKLKEVSSFYEDSLEDLNQKKNRR